MAAHDSGSKFWQRQQRQSMQPVESLIAIAIAIPIALLIAQTHTHRRIYTLVLRAVMLPPRLVKCEFAEILCLSSLPFLSQLLYIWHSRLYLFLFGCVFVFYLLLMYFMLYFFLRSYFYISFISPAYICTVSQLDPKCSRAYKHLSINCVQRVMVSFIVFPFSVVCPHSPVTFRADFLLD